MEGVQVSLWVLLAAVGGVASFPGYDYHGRPKYSFKYGVNDAYTGDVKQHSERREGEVVRGRYSLVEPEGSVRQVDYSAGPVNGFSAVVLKSAPSVHSAVAKPATVANQKPVVVDVAAAPLDFFPGSPVHYDHEHIADVAFPGIPHTWDHYAYNAYFRRRHIDYIQ